MAHLAKEGAHKGPAHSVHPCINLRLQAGGRRSLMISPNSCIVGTPCKKGRPPVVQHSAIYSCIQLFFKKKKEKRKKKNLHFFVCNCSSDFQIGLSPGLKRRPRGSENGAGQGCGFCLSRYCGPWFHHVLLLASVPANVQLGIRQPLGLFQF